MTLRHVSIAFLLCLALTALPLAADEAAWTPIGPEGGSVTSLAAAPSRPAVVYAGLNHSGVYRSTDRGRTWRPTSLRREFIVDLAVDPTRPDTVYAGTYTALLRSTDGGATWSRLDVVSTPVVYPFDTVRVHPRNPAILFVVNGQFLYRSTDRGRAWAALTEGPHWVRSLAFAPGRPNVVYAGAYDGLWKSLDTGRTWRHISDDPPGISAVAVDPRSHRVIYGGRDDGSLLKSTDGGATWRTTLAGTNNVGVAALAVDPADPSLVYASQAGILHSRDGGGSWVRGGAGLRLWPQSALAALPGALLAGTGDGIFSSGDRGRTFRPSQRGLTALPILDLSLGEAIEGEDPPRLFAAATHSLFKTRDRGASWLLLPGPRNYNYGPPRPLRIDPTDPETVYTSLVEGVARSTNGGRRWTEVRQHPCIIPAELLIDPRDPDVVYAWASGYFTPFCVLPGACTFKRSLDAGLTWKCAESKGLLLGIDPFTSAVYMGGRDALWSSTDHGTTWTRISDGPGRIVTALTPSPLVPGTLWAASTGEVGRSRDGGRTWTFSSAGLPAGEWLTLAADRIDPELLYAASVSKGVFKSTDAGETWAPVGAWPAGALRQGPIVIDAADPSILYVGTDNASVLMLDQED
jgi:photosystem II stability/assembly factor-like uncharacterized protein